MSTINKLISKMVTTPLDFKESDLDKVMSYFDYTKFTASGSGIKYVNYTTSSTINFHRPHGDRNSIRPSTLRDIVRELKNDGRILNIT